MTNLKLPVPPGFTISTEAWRAYLRRPDSVHFFERVGLDYVSCSPFRVPVARFEAGRGLVSDRDKCFGKPAKPSAPTYSAQRRRLPHANDPSLQLDNQTR